MNDQGGLREVLRTTILGRESDVELDLDALVIEPILNWGGFTNRSFRVSDGRRRYFLKLSRDLETTRGLARWHSMAETIEKRFHGPRMCAWVEVKDGGYAGALFDWLDGDTVDPLSAEFKARVSSTVRDLHADDTVASRLRVFGDPGTSCAEAYLGSYHDRFREDLAFVSANPPAFVTPKQVQWMEREAGELARRVYDAASFRCPADRPIHADLWANKVMIDHDGHWYLLDWDGLRLGDPVMDWAMLFGPSRESVRIADEKEVTTHVALKAAERERLALYARASLLDWIIDPLADWMQAASETEHSEQVRLANRRVHEKALEAYCRRYGA